MRDIGTGMEEEAANFRFNKEEKEESKPYNKQRDNIVRYFTNRDVGQIIEPKNEITQEERDVVMKKFAKGEIDRESIEDFLLHIASPIEINPQQLYNNLTSDSDLSESFIDLMGAMKDKEEKITGNDLKFFHKHFPDPQQYDALVAGHMQEYGIEDEEMRKFQVEIFNKLAEVLYGKRREYQQQILLMKKEAFEGRKSGEFDEVDLTLEEQEYKDLVRPQIKQEIDFMRQKGIEISLDNLHDFQLNAKHWARVRNMGGIDKMRRQLELRSKLSQSNIHNIEKSILIEEGGEEVLNISKRSVEIEEEVNEFNNYKISELSEDEIQKVKDLIEIRGGDMLGKKLTKEMIEKEGLLPKYRINIGDKSLLLSSSPYKITRGRTGVMAFVEKGDKYLARSFYRSKSQGIWRYLPEYLLEDGKIAWLDKGYGEQSVNLPMQIQLAFDDLSKLDNPIEVSDPDLMFAGTAKNLVRKDYYDAKTTFKREVEAMPHYIKGIDYVISKEKGKKKEKISPEKLTPVTEQCPDFSKVMMSWDQEMPLYGNVHLDVFKSNDGELTYTFCSDEVGRTWIANIEDNSEIKSTGLRKNWVDGGDLVTPAYEYTKQDGNYGNPAMQKDEYIDMYENYLRYIPMIKEYNRLKEEVQK